MSKSLMLEPADQVQSLWTTQVIISQLEGVADWLRSDPRELLTAGSQYVELNTDLLSVGVDDLQKLWRRWFKQLGAEPSQLAISLECWGPGYEAPAVATRADLTGWLFLRGEPPTHSDSGTVAVLDPRTASAMSAVPGLPWGRSLVLQPLEGALLIVPGWLTASVLPLEPGQTAVVMRASCMTDTTIERR